MRHLCFCMLAAGLLILSGCHDRECCDCCCLPPTPPSAAAQKKLVLVAYLDMKEVFRSCERVHKLQEQLQEKFGQRAKTLEAVSRSAKDANTFTDLEKAYQRLIAEVEVERAKHVREILKSILISIEKCAKAQDCVFVIRIEDGAKLPPTAGYKRYPPPNLDETTETKLLEEFRRDVVLYRSDDKVDFPNDVSDPIDITTAVVSDLTREPKSIPILKD